MFQEESSLVPTDPAASQEITGLLKAWGKGESSALGDLIPLVYPELKRLARLHMHGRECETLQTTALVHEAYIRLVDLSRVRWQDRAHFFAMAAKIMRGILVDAARARGSRKRGGLVRRIQASTDIDLDQIPDLGLGRAEEILAIHEALDSLAKMDARQAQVVEMRFFGGLTAEEAAEVLKISPQSVLRDWKLAKAWLSREMRRGKDAGAH